MRTAGFAMLFCAALAAQAQEDVGVVDRVSGDVTYAAPGGSPAKAIAFMRVREGDRFELGGGSEVRIVYLKGGLQERWLGPASFVAGAEAGAPRKGKPAEAVRLPATVPARIARVPQLMQNARLGGVGLRGGIRPERTAADDAILEDARATYAKLRRERPRDDVTAELYLLATLDEYRLYEEMVPLAEELLRKQPQSDQFKALAAHVKARAGR